MRPVRHVTPYVVRAGVACLRCRSAWQPLVAARVRHASTQFVGQDGAAAAGANKGTKKPVASSVKKMPPPPKRVAASSPLASEPLPPTPLAAVNQPLFDVAEMITALAEVFLAYHKHLRGEATAAPVDMNESGGSNVSVPFYPHVPLRYMEEHFQPLLRRLLPAGGGSGATAVMRLLGENESAEKNRRQLSSRIQVCGVFSLAPSPPGILPRKEGSDGTGEMIALRVRPGVRELALSIATFLFSLEPSPAGIRKTVPLAVIRRMSLSPAAAAFIRNELANDIKRLLLLYGHDVFVLTRNGSAVRLHESCVRKVERGPPPALPIATTPLPAQQQQEKMERPETLSGETREKSGRMAVVETTTTLPPPEHASVSFVAGEADTVLHMGRRFIAPAAMERYRLSQRLQPILEFVPEAAPSLGAGKVGRTSVSHTDKNDSTDADDGFVDFVAVRERAVVKYPHLAPLLALDHGDAPQFRDGLLLSAIGALGVEWRWGRAPPPREPRPKHHTQQRIVAHSGLSSEMGLLFLRRRSSGVAAPPAVEKQYLRLLLVDLQVEHDEVVASHSSEDWWKRSCNVYSADDASDGTSVEENEDAIGRLFSIVHAAVYDELAGPAAAVGAAEAEVGSHLLGGMAPSRSSMYPTGACADRVFVQHLLRYFTTNQHEPLQGTLLNGVQGVVSPLFQHEIAESIACLFFPYGQGNAEKTAVMEGTTTSNSNSDGGRGPGIVVFNKYVEGFYVNTVFAQLPHIRPRVFPEEPPLASRKLLPANLLLEVVRCLHREQLRHAEEIGLEVDVDDDGFKDDTAGDDGCLSFASFREVLQPTTRAYIRDNIGDLVVIPLLVACHPRYFRVPTIDGAPSWSTIGLSREGRLLARQLEAAALLSETTTAVAPLLSELDGGRPSSYRSRRTGCLFTNDTQQQLAAFWMLR
ncbi:hypothetical protein DQ04_00791090 [Trypanosoma grayi]|uniref:hypothetical protein n=1 Tax=Trypanosoma grayi TaxID=71804 RepID=UPI0004F48A9E|nr:hypothetical protein DQ04_00791090 [Trypanosoma grayi]KEG13779.1 hypothetical protein DQ04_00791090 [Trypanosoma grayi]